MQRSHLLKTADERECPAPISLRSRRRGARPDGWQSDAPNPSWPQGAVALEARRLLAALIRAVAALSAPSMRRVVVLSLGLAILTFAVLWLAVAVTLYNTVLFD